MEDVSILYGHLAYFTVYCVAIWYILWPFGTLYGYLEYFPPFWYVVPRKIWQPWSQAEKRHFSPKERKKLIEIILV
jgi:hypothetical protein